MVRILTGSLLVAVNVLFFISLIFSLNYKINEMQEEMNWKLEEYKSINEEKVKNLQFLYKEISNQCEELRGKQQDLLDADKRLRQNHRESMQIIEERIQRMEDDYNQLSTTLRELQEVGVLM
jgi:peptidoglycan hydrolase CwlO-like protein